MTAPQDDLPYFEHPPVVETVLSVQFEPLPGLRAAQIGLYWSRIRERYPVTEERAPLDPVIERFPEPLRRPFAFRVSTGEAPPAPRIWFVHQNRNELLQVQSDRFIRNWRKTGKDDSYPRYEKIRKWFDEDFSEFCEFVSQEKLGSISISQCEVTYVNHIVAGDGWSSYDELDEVLALWRQPSALIPGKAEDARFHARFPITDAQGKRVGRLHADLDTGFSETHNLPIFVLSLTARGILGEATEFFDLGRSWIVRSFAELTTPRMHKVWKRSR